MNLTISLNLDDVVDDMFCDADIDCELGASPSRSFSEEIKSSVLHSVSRSLIDSISKEALEKSSKVALDCANKFTDDEIESVILGKLRAGVLTTSRGTEISIDDIIEERIKRFDVDAVIRRHIEQKTEAFAKDLKVRYDNVFAAKVVQGLSKQKMLDPNVAKLLLGD
jgi:hypothetical protein